MGSNCPVGVLDSGVGGLSVLERIHRLLPEEDLLYVADSAYAPYGPRSAGEILGRCEVILDFFRRHEVKAVVLACNTATAAAVAELRARHDLPIVGMEPAVKPAAELSRSGVVGVLATAGTLDSEKFVVLRNRFIHQVEIVTRACPGLVEHIEERERDEAGLMALLGEFVEPMVAKGADVLVLGCTHYSLITGRIGQVAGPAVTVMDSGAAVARELQRRLRAEGLEAEPGREGTVRFFTSGDPGVQQELISHYWGRPAAVRSMQTAEAG